MAQCSSQSMPTLRSVVLIYIPILVLFQMVVIFMLSRHSERINPSKESIVESLVNVQLLPNTTKKTTTTTTTKTTSTTTTTTTTKSTPPPKKDWTNYTQLAQEEARTGLGEQGAPVKPRDLKDLSQKAFLFGQNGFNAHVSDVIALNRSIRDIRHPNCKKKLYLENLATVSVIIPFRDEHMSTLLRSVYSVINRSPKQLLKEIILVDDFSYKSFLKAPLDSYLAAHFPKELVRVIRLNSNQGLIRTRMAGARAAKGDILVFFDSHVECSVNWLPPLIEPIVIDIKTVTCPFIDVIDFDTLEYREQDSGARGAFDWQFFYKRLPLVNKTQDPTDPFDSPVMAGGLFAISRKWFEHLGGYDEGLDAWGGEQYELSFKIWQCGGRLIDIPCSRVGHIYRRFSTYSFMGAGDYLSRNYKRVAEVWMDEYKEILYNHSVNVKYANAGNLTKQLELRTKLKCKPFKWFMENVLYDMDKYYPHVPPPPYAYGEIKNMALNLCIDAQHQRKDNQFGLNTCDKSHRSFDVEEEFELGWRADIRCKSREMCWDVSVTAPEAPVIIYDCHGIRGNQEFKYDLDTKQIYHFGTKQCLDADQVRKVIYMNPCNATWKTQQWAFDHVNADLIRRDFMKK